MSSILYTCETCYFTTIEDLAVFQPTAGKVHMYKRAVVELIFDPDQRRFYVLCVDMASSLPARCFPAPEPIEDFEGIAGETMPAEAKGYVLAIRDWR